jgi:hypothetical protein
LADNRSTDSSAPDVVKKVRDRLSEAWEHDKDNRKDAASDLNFLAGNQWPDGVKQQREDEGRPMLTINRLPQFVRQVTNDIRQADIGIKVAPSDGAVANAEQVTDPKADQRGMEQAGMGHNGGPEMQQQPKQSSKKHLTMAEVYNGLIREIQYRSSAAHAYATAAEHQTSCGIGHFRILTKYVSDDAFDQEIVIEPVMRPLSVYWDPAAVKIDRADAQWCIVTDVVPRASFKSSYPKAAEVDVENFDEQPSGLYWSSSDTVRIAEYWCRKPVKRTIARLKDGEVIELEKGIDPKTLPIVDTREVDSYVVEQYIVSGSEILEGPTEWAGKFIPIIPVIGSEIPLEDKTMRYGLIRFARDPQQLYNYARTSAAESMGQAPKSPYLVTPTMIKAFKGIWDNANKALTPYLPFTPDPEQPGGPSRLAPPDVPMAYVQEAAVADGDIKATVGMYDPQLGQKSNENSGKAILARERQGDTGTFHYSDNLRRSLEHAGRILLEIIPKIYDNDRVIRILGEDDAEMYLPINRAAGYDENGEPIYINDITVGRYDCRVKIGPSYATKRMESADSMMQFMQAVPASGQFIGDLVAKNMDWPGSEAIAERLKRAVPAEILGEDAPQQAPDPMAEKAAEMQAKGLEAEVAEMAAKVDKLLAESEKAEAEKKKIEAETQKIEAETQLLPLDRDVELEKYEADREDKREEAALSRAQQEQQFSMRNQGANGAFRPSGESNIYEE